MYFPNDMTFQYFFLDTYIGYFLQALPIALLVGGGYGFFRFRADRTTPLFRKFCACLFVCYLTGLLCLVIGLDIMGIAWYRLLYRMEPGTSIGWFSGEFDLMPDFFRHISGEGIGNFLMFLPFGVLFPLSREACTWNKTVCAGVITVFLIELFQPIVGRSFDTNDIILNTLGIAVSASAFFAFRKLAHRRTT